jgi:hypothetical protein
MMRLLSCLVLLTACSAPADAQQAPAPAAAPRPAAAPAQNAPAPAAPAAPAQNAAAPARAESTGQPALTIYNGGFAVVRELLDLQLKDGVNQIAVSGMTSTLEPDSVILRDPTGARALAIMEQSYRNDPVTQERLLSLFEGKTIHFQVQHGDATSVIEGRVVRSGYVAPQALYDQWGNWRGPPPQGQPVIDVGGELRFALPGLPLFPSLGDDTVLQPTLGWTLQTDAGGPLQAELAYLTGGFTWEADYNAVSEEGSGKLDLVGWITMQNGSGKTFREAKVKLMAGDVSKVSEQDARRDQMRALGSMAAEKAGGPPVTEKSFDEFHLYTVARPVTLRDAESKQVEFARAEGVPESRLYVYDGAAIAGQPGGDWGNADYRYAPDFGTENQKKVWVVREFRNDEKSGLGIPLPKGKVRFYTRDKDGQLEFVGENLIDHTPKDEVIRLYTGNAFDLVGERTRTDYKVSTAEDWMDEDFSIKLRNHKKEAVTFTVVEHLYRWSNWEIRKPSLPFVKKDSRTAEFSVEVPADGEVEVSYAVHYSW